MRRFTLKSNKYLGLVEAIYNDGILMNINFAHATVPIEGIKYIKNTTPVLVENVYTNFEGSSIVVFETDFEVTFDDFKKVYGYLRNTHLAEALWPKLTTGEQYQCYIQGIEYCKYCLREKAWYKPMQMDKWLRTKQYKNNWKIC
jgi:hypothetical protein